jgi:hypothetical protein
MSTDKIIDAWMQHPCLAGLESLELEPEVERLFLHENAKEVFRLPDVGAAA